GRVLAAICLALTLLNASVVGASREGAPPLAWQRLTYHGAIGSAGSGQPPTHIPSYSIAYPPGWTAQQWPDSLAGYGQLALWPPGGGTIDLILLPLRRHGPTLADLIAHDLSFLPRATRNTVPLPLGMAIRLSDTDNGAGRTIQIIYLRRQGVVYRFFSSRPLGSGQEDVLREIASRLRVPAAPAAPATPPIPAAPQSGSLCCHCPAWGAGWGKVLTHLDGIPVFSNAANIDNGCDGTSGTLYQCVELVQRYYTLRWGYPAIWGGVGAAADMRSHHPSDILFIPNGGSQGPREGDAVLFYGGAFGHVALVRHVDRRLGVLDVVEENWSPTGEARLTIYSDNMIAIRDSAYGSYTIAGWLHSPLNGSSS
ncbi:MAG TPA: CHAP domain-containing protein, partial [Chloroflexota bacterium]|nr:CHAP domain-containing protein [Chloroflexota bacterium]